MKIPTRDLTDVTLAIEETDEDYYEDGEDDKDREDYVDDFDGEDDENDYVENEDDDEDGEDGGDGEDDDEDVVLSDHLFCVISNIVIHCQYLILLARIPSVPS